VAKYCKDKVTPQEFRKTVNNCTWGIRRPNKRPLKPAGNHKTSEKKKTRKDLAEGSESHLNVEAGYTSKGGSSDEEEKEKSAGMETGSTSLRYDPPPKSASYRYDPMEVRKCWLVPPPLYFGNYWTDSGPFFFFL